MIDKESLKGSLNPKLIVERIQFMEEFYKTHPNFFHPSGLLVFCGPQGSGKTLSAVSYVQKLTYSYPKAILVTNMQIEGINPETTILKYMGIESLLKVKNGFHGVIFLIDEIHLQFNSQDSKNVPLEVMKQAAQQRKQRIHIVGTSQKFNRLSKPFREQINVACLCRSYFTFLQVNKFVLGEESEEKDGKLNAPCKYRTFWFHNPKLYNNYDTFEVMATANTLNEISQQTKSEVFLNG